MTTRLHFSLLFFFKGKSQDWRNVFWKYADAFCYCPLSVIFKPVNPIERGKATYASQRMPTIHSTNFTTGTAVFLRLWTAMHAKQQYRHLPSLLYTSDVFQLCFLLLMTPLVSVGSASAAQCQQDRAACGRLREQPSWSAKGLTPRTDIRCCHPLQESTEHTVLLEKCD